MNYKIFADTGFDFTKEMTIKKFTLTYKNLYIFY